MSKELCAGLRHLAREHAHVRREIHLATILHDMFQRTNQHPLEPDMRLSEAQMTRAAELAAAALIQDRSFDADPPEPPSEQQPEPVS